MGTQEDACGMTTLVYYLLPFASSLIYDICCTESKHSTENMILTRNLQELINEYFQRLFPPAGRRFQVLG